MARYNKRIMAIKDDVMRIYMKHVYREVHYNKFGYFGVMTGPPGSGKTETAMLMAYLQDDTFTVDNLKERVFFEPKYFLKAIDQFKKYSWIVWSETGITLSSKKWNTVSNIMVEDVIQTMRLKTMGVVFDSQAISFVDNRARSMFQWFNEIRRFEHRPPKMKVHRIRLNQIKSKMVYPYPLFRLEDGQAIKLRDIEIKARLPKKYLREFDEIHRAFKEKLWKRHARMIDKIEADENPMTVHEMIAEVKANREKYMSNNMLSKELVSIDFDVGNPTATRIVKFIQREDKLNKNAQEKKAHGWKRPDKMAKHLNN